MWAVFHIRSNEKELTIDGPTPLPWTIDLRVLAALRTAPPSITPDADKQYTREAKDYLRDILVVLKAGQHRYNFRLAAEALVCAQALAAASPTPGDYVRAWWGPSSPAPTPSPSRRSLRKSSPCPPPRSALLPENGRRQPGSHRPVALP